MTKESVSGMQMASSVGAGLLAGALFVLAAFLLEGAIVKESSKLF